MSKYIEDRLQKWECLNCEEHFILGQRITENKIKQGIEPVCPYCESCLVEPVAELREDAESMGCMGIYYYEDELED